MFQVLSQLIYHAIKVSAIVAVNFSLFIILPVTHNLFSSISVEKKEAIKQPKIVAEMIRKEKPPEKKQPEQRIRQVQNASTQSSTSNTRLKFTPDLGVESGEGVAVASQTMETTVFEDGKTDEDAVPMFTPAPQYPQRARDLGVEGLVEIIFVVGTDGKVISIESLNSPHTSFNQEVRKVLSSWKFKPAKNQGVPVQVRKKQVIEYRLNS